MAAVVGSDWRGLLQLRMWTPLRELSIDTRKLSENVRKIEDCKYLVVVESDLAGNAEDGPYVTMIAWAETDGAALRAIDGALEADARQSKTQEPPIVLLPGEAASTYGVIIVRLKKLGESILESGEYRIASDGAFLHKVVRSSRAAVLLS